MDLPIKQLKQNDLIFVPLTVSEAVLVKDSGTIITLNDVLDKKLELVITPAGSGLLSYRLDKNIIITHSNEILANNSALPLLVRYDSRGHIVETKPIGKIEVIVDNECYVEIDGSQDTSMVLGDDFDIDKGKIILKWNNL